MDTSIQTPPAARKITVRKLNFYYGAYQALTNIDLEVAEKRI
ncbi:MAG: phosphate ABC transporter ATP-binding protein, partial [Betaproteobacteria bacterium]